MPILIFSDLIHILYRFLQTSVLASLWRILSSEQLKMGDAKLEQLFGMVEVLMRDLGNPLAVISLAFQISQ